MIFVRHILIPPDNATKARIWAYGTYANKMFCSKYILAEALFEKACLAQHPEITEVVCASSGNLAASVALLALRQNMRAVIFLPVYVSQQTIGMLHLMGAKVIHSTMTKLTEEIAPIARAYADADSSRHFLDQFDLSWCSDVYTRTIFSDLANLLPFDSELRPICAIVTFGTGSLLIATARFLEKLPGDGHQLIPVFIQEPDSSEEVFLAECQMKFQRVEILQTKIPTHDEIEKVLRRFSPMFEIPFGIASAACMTVALDHQQQVSQTIDIVPILTDALFTSNVSFQNSCKI